MQELLEEFEKIRIVIETKEGEAENLLKRLSEKGYYCYLQQSAFSQYEVVVTGRYDGNIGLARGETPPC